MKNYFSSDFKLGVLGGGQLGKMLLTETHKFDIYTSILDNNENAPCAEICNNFVIGDLLDFDAVYNFGKTVDFTDDQEVNTIIIKRLAESKRTVVIFFISFGF